MKLKTLLLVAFLLGIGMLPAMSQTNPPSSSATDVEMQLPWPDATYYFSAIYDNDYDFSEAILPIPPWYPISIMIDNWVEQWDEISGGTGTFSTTGYTNLYIWGPSSWPEIDDGYCMSLPSGSTNSSIWPPQPFNTSVNYGSLNFNSSLDGSMTLAFNDQSQVTMLTGGMPGSTDTELYQISGFAEEITYTDQTITSGTMAGFQTNISNTRIKVSNFGSLSTNGLVYASLPAHSKVTITPSVTGSIYNQANVAPLGLPLTWTCVATTPANQARTDLGVGEQVNMTAPGGFTNTTWSTTGGGLAHTVGGLNLFTAPSNAPSGGVAVTITATVNTGTGVFPVKKTFIVVEPNGHGYAEIVGTNHYADGVIGAGMTNVLWMYPTNVSFYRVQLIELPCYPTNITGYCTNMTINPVVISPTVILQDNSFADRVSCVVDSPNFPLYPGSYEFDVPVKWQIVGSSLTNNYNVFPMTCKLLDASGDFSVSKYGLTITRGINDVSY